MGAESGADNARVECWFKRSTGTTRVLLNPGKILKLATSSNQVRLYNIDPRLSKS